MSSISAESETRLVEVFEREFAVAAERLREMGLQPLETGFDKTASSYYREREKTQLDRSDFELNLDDPEDVKRHFRRNWTRDETEVLEELVGHILALADVCDDVEQSTDVSPFIYAMF
jgi:hypothetical protein